MKYGVSLILLLGIYSCDYRRYPQEEQWKKEIQEMQDHPGPYREQDQQENRRKG